MFVRQLVSAWLRQAAQERLQETVAEITRGGLSAGEDIDPTSGEAEDSPSLPCAAAFIFALNVESGGLVDRLARVTRRRFKSRVEYDGLLQGRRVLVVDSGVGSEPAQRACKKVIERYRPAWVVSAGFAGALHPDVRRGHVVMADSVADLQGQSLQVGLKVDPQTVAATRGLHVGRLLTVDRVIRSPKEKRALGQGRHAVACDMESMGVAEVCRREKARFLSVRVISDGVDDELPPELEMLVNQKTSAARVGAATAAIFRRPSSVKDMWRLKEEAIKASDRLASFLEGVFVQLQSADSAESSSSTSGEPT